LAVKHCIFAFGIVVIVAILIQKMGGTIAVSPLASAVITGLIAALVGAVVEYETKKMLLPNQ
jgi:LytS/YehU family sensor histidine kinase